MSEQQQKGPVVYPASPADKSDAIPTTSEAASETDSSTGVDQPREIGGRKGPDPTRYGDWEKNGRCIDF
ncbi:MAG: DUF1674 domain-containing protein [Pseudomonadota bacterium]